MGKKTVGLEKKRHVNVSSWQFYLFGKSQRAQKRRWSGSITDVCIFMTVTTQETQSNALKANSWVIQPLNLEEINEESILEKGSATLLYFKSSWEKIKEAFFSGSKLIQRVSNWHVGMTSPDIFFIKLHIVNSFGCQMTWFIAIFQTLANQIFRAI